jgi:hypothetical protein
MKNKHITCFWLGILMSCSVLIVSCDLINPDEELPATIRLEPFNFQIQPGQGSGNQKITEVWVFANSNVLGAFAPPVDIRHLLEGPTKFLFYPGIRNNGLVDNAIIYPMYTADSIQVNSMHGAIFDFQPVTRYKPNTIFSLVADFELNNEFVDNRDTVEASRMIRSTTDVFEGSYSGEIIISKEAFFIEVGHAVPMAGLPIDGRPSYLEFRYKNDVEFAIGILGIQLNGQSFSDFFYLVRPTDEWNMLYIDLTQRIIDSQFPSYKVLIRSAYPDNATEESYSIFLDNIKVVHL